MGFVHLKDPIVFESRECARNNQRNYRLRRNEERELMTRKLEEFAATIDDLKDTIQAMKIRLEESEEKNADLERANGQLDFRLQESEERIVAHVNRARREHLEILALRSQTETLRQTISDYQQYVERLERRITPHAPENGAQLPWNFNAAISDPWSLEQYVQQVM